MPDFFDQFFLVVVILVAALATVDWLLGRDGREQLKQIVGDLWTRLQYSTIDDLAISSIVPIRRLLNKVFGKKFGWRLVISAFVFNLVTIEIVASYLLRTEYIFIISRNYLRADFVVQLAQSLVISVSLLGWVPFKWLLASVNSEIGPNTALKDWGAVIAALITKLILFSIAYSFVFCVIFVLLAYSISYAFAQIDISDIGSDPDGIADILLQVVYTYLAISFIAVVPLLAWLVALMFLLTLRFLRPWLQPITVLLLERLYESEKGVLTQFALGFGFVAKLIQEVLKYTGVDSG